MTVKVNTYNDPMEILRNDGIENFFKNKIHVCATSNMSNALKQSLSIRNDKDKFCILSMNEFTKVIFPSWNSEETKFYQYIELSEKLESIKQNDDYSVYLIDSFKKNQSDVLQTLRLLKFIKVESSMLKNVLNKLESPKKDKLLFDLFLWFDELKVVNSQVEENSKKSKELLFDSMTDFTPESVIFHGFYFITPEQQVVLETAQERFEKIKFLNFYDKKYPDKFSFINKFLGPEFGWPEVNSGEAFNYKRQNGMGDVFLSSLSDINSSEETKMSTIKLNPFDNFTDYLDFISEHYIVKANGSESFKSDVVLLATNSEYMNGRLQEFYPEFYKGFQNFLKYPIGILFMTIYEMWDPGEKKIHVTTLSIKKLLATGFFFDSDDENYLNEVFKSVESFFVGCDTLSSWEEQLRFLIVLNKKVRLRYEFCESSHVSGNYKESKNNSPFSFLPYFSITVEALEVLEKKIFEIFKLIKTLLGEDSSPVELKTQLKKMLKIVKKSSGKYGTSDIDRGILKDLQEKLSIDPNISRVNKDNISDAINFYLRGSSNDENPKIGPLINIDGEVFKENHIHVTGMDEKGLPYGEYQLPWPLNNDTLEMLANKNRYIKLLEYRNESVIDITRYLLYILFQFGDDIELSYIRNYQDNVDLEESFYLKLLGANISKESYNKPIGDARADDESMSQKIDIKEFSEDARAAFSLCKKRALFQEINNCVSYYSEFQQEYILPKIANHLSISLSKDEVKSLLKIIYPNADGLLTDIETSEEKNTVSFINNLKNSYKGRNQRKPLMFLGRKWTKGDEVDPSIKKIYNDANNLSVVDLSKENLSIVKKCWACPYSMICSTYKGGKEQGEE